MKNSASRSIALLLASAAIAVAQDEQPPQPVQPPTPVPVPAQPRPPVIQPAAPAAQPAPGNAGNNVPLADTPIKEAIYQPKMNGADLAKLYQQYTGRRVLVTAAANQAEFAFEQAPPLTFGEAAKLLRKAAVLEGFVFVPDASDDNLDILTTTTGGANPKGQGLEIYTEHDKLPEGGQVVSYVMPLRYLKPETAAQIFNQVVGQVGAYGSITPVPNAAAIVITENTTLIRRLIQLKDEVDKPGSNVSQKFIKVQFADVTELAQTLNDLLNSQQQTQRTAGVQRTEAAPAAPGGARAGAGAEAASAGEDTPIQIVPDARTNRIFAMGRPVDLLFVETLVREFDVQSDNKNFLRRKLHFLSVRDFLPIAGDALTRAFTGTGSGGGGGQGGASGANFGSQGGGRGASGGSGNRSTQTGGGSRAQTSSPFGGSSGGSSGGFGGSSGGGAGSSGGGSRGNTLQAPDVSTAPESILVGRTLLVADNITNSIVVQGTPASVEIIEKLLDEVDVKADQVMISCVFGQLALGKGHSFGVDYLRTVNGASNRVGGRGGSGSGPGMPLFPGGNTPALGTDPAIPFNPGALAGAGLGLYGRLGKNMHIYLNALQEKSDFKVLARPTIYTSNNQKGVITSGTKIAIPTNTVQYTGSSSPSTSFEYQDVDLSLEVVPLINSKDEITLQIYLVSNDIGKDRDVGSVADGQAPLKIPDIIKRELLTTVTVPNNETIVLGGLITTRDEKSKTGIPILSQIPLIGGLFGTQTVSKERDELLIFIQPSIVHDQRSLDAVQADTDRRFKVAPDARAFSEGPGVLPVKDDSILPVEDKGKDSGSAGEAKSAPRTKATPSRKAIGPGKR